MGFVANSGFQKLLVLSGTSKLPDIEDWKHPEEYKPQYYVESLDVLDNILKNIYKT